MKKTSESGSVLVFAALVLIAICGMIAIAVDGARLADAHTEKKATADHAALVALEAYLGSEIDPVQFPTHGDRHAERFRLAVNAAAAVGGWNYLTARFGEQHIQNKSQLWTGIDAGPGSHGSIKSGRWWTERPSCSSGSPTCPCDSSVPLPCFQECSDGNAACAPINGVMSQVLPGDPDARLYANAIKVSLFTGSADSDKMTNFFASVLGIMFSTTGATSTAANSAISAVLPKSTVILFDLSRTTTVENFLPWERVPPNPAHPSYPYRREYSYRLNNGPCPPVGPVNNWAIQGPVAAAPGSYPTVVGLKSVLPGGTGPGNISPWKQAWRDLGAIEQAKYQCVNAWTANGLPAQRYLVWTDPTGNTRPEPLYSMFDALADTLRAIRKSAAPVDKVGVVFFDHQDNIAPRVFDLKSVLDPQFAILQQIADTSPPHDSTNPAWNKRIEYGIFPRTVSNAYAGSDPTQAFGRAFKMFQDGSNLFYADNSVILVTNGMANCAYDATPTPPNATGRYCRGYLRANALDQAAGADFNPAVVPINQWGAYKSEWANAEIAAPTQADWDDVYRLHKYSLSASLAGPNVVNYEKNKIRLNIELVGRHVVPHTLMLKSLDTQSNGGPSVGCMKDLEIRRRNYMWVLNSPFYSTSIDDLITNSVGWQQGDPRPDDDVSNNDPYEANPDVKRRYMRIGYVPRLGNIPSPGEYSDRWTAGNPEGANDQEGAYYQPNQYYYSSVRALQGAWIPVRKARCIANTLATLDGLCESAAPTPPEILVGTASSLATSDYNYKPASQFADPLVVPANPLTPPTLDINGRVMCDPELLPANSPPNSVYPTVYNTVQNIQSERPIVLVSE